MMAWISPRYLPLQWQKTLTSRSTFQRMHHGEPTRNQEHRQWWAAWTMRKHKFESSWGDDHWWWHRHRSKSWSEHPGGYQEERCEACLRIASCESRFWQRNLIRLTEAKSLDDKSGEVANTCIVMNQHIVATSWMEKTYPLGMLPVNEQVSYAVPLWGWEKTYQAILTRRTCTTQKC